MARVCQKDSNQVPNALTVKNLGLNFFLAGHEHASFEIVLARSIVAASEKAMDIDIADLEANKIEENHDYLYTGITDYMKVRGLYPAVHPIKKYVY